MAVPARDAESQAQEALAAGDSRRALTTLMAAYGDEIYRHVRLIVGDADLADEVHQSVFVQAFRDLASFGGRSTWKSWLYAIARHRCLDALKLRRRWRRRFRLGGESHTLPERADPSRAADEGVADRALAKAMESCLLELAPKVRVAVVLRFHEGLSFEDMAAICGERPATLQARVARALPALRAELAKRGFEP